MKALVFDLRLDSLYSVRIPFTWMSALTYPVLPPSTIKGLLANALQRYKNDKHPVEYLKAVEENVVWTGSRLMSPCIIKSYITSAIVKWEVKLGDKSTNALGRQFAFTKEMQVAVILKNEEFIDDLKEGLESSPLTCGDSESAATIVSEISVKEVRSINRYIITTSFPVYSTDGLSLIKGNGKIFPMHERCLKSGEEFPLLNYIVPITEDRGVLKPTQITIEVKNSNIYVFTIDDLGTVVKVQ